MTITLTREEAQQVLDSLEWIANQRTGGMIQRKATEPIETLRTKLAQPKKEWVWLTKEERKAIFDLCDRDDRGYVALMVEAKLKEKNQ